MIVPKLAIPILSLFASSYSLPLSHSPPYTSSSYSKRQDRPQVSQDELNGTLLRPALFSRVAYCSAGAISSWTCGSPCEALGSVEVFSAGGDDGAIPGYFIAHDKTSGAIIVAHQGTEKTNVLSVLNDLQIDLVTPNASYFPSTVGTDIEVHAGFQATFERTANAVRSTVLDVALPKTGATRIIATGHSLGAAIAVLDGMMLTDALKDKPVQVETRAFGLPRTGNDKWANWIESTLGSNFSFVTNQDDPVPRLPPTSLGYSHALNEIHIQEVDAVGNPTNVIQCIGREDEACSSGLGLFDLSITNHAGPYLANISFGGSQCPF